MADSSGLTHQSAPRRAADVLDDRALAAFRVVGGWGYSARELAEVLGVCETAARDACRRLRERGLVDRGQGPGGIYWSVRRG